MRGRILMTLAAGTGLWLSGSQAADTAKTAKSKTTQPATVVTNQAVTEAVVARIKAAGSADGATVHLKVEKGVVHLTGECRTAAQQQEIAKHCMGVEGVREVVLGMKVVTGIEQASMMQSPEPIQLTLQPPAAPAPMPMAMPSAPGGYYPQDPVPLVAPGGAGYDPYGPKLPNNAWPTYAPYPNMSRVAHPQAYPYNAFPYIGPYYPFPKVPMGWRTVQLSWEDGHWYMGKVSTPHDYWRVRFW